jgi:N-acetylglutamate synthase-like GNAT family acetyltransferase
MIEMFKIYDFEKHPMSIRWNHHLETICIEKIIFEKEFLNSEIFEVIDNSSDNEIIGVVFLKREEKEKSKFIIFILPEKRRYKHGTEVLKIIESTINERRIKYLTLISVEECNALKFYENNNFNMKNKEGRYIFLTKEFNY